MNIVILGHTGSIGKYIYNEFVKLGYNVQGYSTSEFNASDEKQVLQLSKNIAKQESLDAFINCIGVVDFKNFKELESFNYLLNVNLKAAFCLSLAAADNMALGSGGSIVNLGSIASNRIRSGRIGYTTTKTALEGMTRSIAFEYAKNKITVNCVAPGPTQTQLLFDTLERNEIDRLTQKIPLGRLTYPDDIFETVHFLITKNKFITGQTIIVDGGLSIKSGF